MVNSMPCSYRQTGLSSGTKFSDIGRTVFEKDVTIVVLEICLLEKALIEVDCNLEAVGNGGKSALLNTKEILLIDNGWYLQYHRNPHCFCI